MDLLSHPSNCSKRGSWYEVYFWLFSLQCIEALPPAHSSVSSFYQIAANFMESLVMLSSPFVRANNFGHQNGNKVVSQGQKHNKTGNTRQNRGIQTMDGWKHQRTIPTGGNQGVAHQSILSAMSITSPHPWSCSSRLAASATSKLVLQLSPSAIIPKVPPH